MNYSKLSNTWLCNEHVKFLPNTTEHYNNPKKLWYVHIPKTGGSLIEELLIKYKLARHFENWKSFGIKIIHPSPWHMLPSKFKQLDFSKLNVFVSIRDPIQRILSEFVWQRNRKIKYNEINKWIVESLKSHVKNNNTEDNHFEPQIKFIIDYYGNTIPYDNILICDKYNYHKNIKNFAERNNLTIINFDKAITNMSKYHTNKTDYDYLYRQLKPETVQLIKNYYRDDFVLLEKVKNHYKEKAWLN